jgi:hypothetical protein
MLETFQPCNEEEVVADDGVSAAYSGEDIVQDNRPWTWKVKGGGGECKQLLHEKHPPYIHIQKLL